MEDGKLSIVMPTYNAQKYLRECLESIDASAPIGTILIVVDDCSDDESIKLVEKHNFRNINVEIVRNSKNLGVTASLNIGLRAANTEFVARMDADDICLPGRFHKQLSMLNSNKTASIICSPAQEFGAASGLSIRPSQGYDHETIKLALLFENPIVHPTVVFRASNIDPEDLVYPSEFPHAEDYALFANLASKYEFLYTNEVTLKYRVHASQVSARFAGDQAVSMRKVASKLLASMGVSHQQKSLFVNSCLGEALFLRPGIDDLLKAWCSKLMRANFSKIGVSETVAANFVSDRLERALNRHQALRQRLSRAAYCYWSLKNVAKYNLSGVS